MHVTKTQAVLYMFSLALKYNYIDKEKVLVKLNINDLKFRRYVQEIRAYFTNFNMNVSLRYNRAEKRYYIIHDDAILRN